MTSSSPSAPPKKAAARVLISTPRRSATPNGTSAPMKTVTTSIMTSTPANGPMVTKKRMRTSPPERSEERRVGKESKEGRGENTYIKRTTRKRYIDKTKQLT